MLHSETEIADKKPNSSFIQKILRQQMHEVHSKPSFTQLIKKSQNFYKTETSILFSQQLTIKYTQRQKKHIHVHNICMRSTQHYLPSLWVSLVTSSF